MDSGKLYSYDKKKRLLLTLKHIYLQYYKLITPIVLTINVLIIFYSKLLTFRIECHNCLHKSFLSALHSEMSKIFY